MAEPNAFCEGGDGPDLSAYPGLVHAPEQHGDFIATATRGVNIADIKAAVDSGMLPHAIAAKFKVPVQEVNDAIRYEDLK